VRVRVARHQARCQEDGHRLRAGQPEGRRKRACRRSPNGRRRPRAGCQARPAAPAGPGRRFAGTFPTKAAIWSGVAPSGCVSRYCRTPGRSAPVGRACDPPLRAGVPAIHARRLSRQCAGATMVIELPRSVATRLTSRRPRMAPGRSVNPSPSIHASARPSWASVKIQYSSSPRQRCRSASPASQRTCGNARRKVSPSICDRDSGVLAPPPGRRSSSSSAAARASEIEGLAQHGEVERLALDGGARHPAPGAPGLPKPTLRSLAGLPPPSPRAWTVATSDVQLKSRPRARRGRARCRSGADRWNR